MKIYEHEKYPGIRFVLNLLESLDDLGDAEVGTFQPFYRDRFKILEMEYLE